MDGRVNAWVVVTIGTLFELCGAVTSANPASTALRLRGTEQIYNLDREEAAKSFREAIAADPGDAAAYRGLATTAWLSITFRRGNMTVDDYLGGITRSHGAPVPPPPEIATAFREAVDHAVALAQQRINQNSMDPEGHYQLGAAVGLRASYTASVEGRALGAFRSAREAYDEHERVLALDSSRKDAELIVGTYRYIVSALSLPTRLMAYVVGFGGNREKGIRMVEEAAAYHGENQDDARFALLLLYNREKRYDDALKTLAYLREKYPRNRLVWLESGSTCLRAGRPADAERFLADGMTRFAGDQRPRMFGEQALWLYKRGAARAWQGRSAQARSDLTESLALEGRGWVHARAHLELGKLALYAHDTASARTELKAAQSLGERDNDPGTAEEARRLLK